MLTILIYDVSNDRRRDRVQRVLKDYGVRVQHSAFEARLTPRERTTLIRRVSAELDPATDRFGLYGITKEQETQLVWVGAARPSTEKEQYFVI